MLITRFQMSFEYRDDILFRAYVLMTGDRGAWKWFCRLRSNRKVRYKLLYQIHKSIRRNGQKTTVCVVRRHGLYYPADGATRLGALLALDRSIRAVRISKKTKKKWRDRKTLDTHHFKGIPSELSTKFNEFLVSFKKKNNEN